tara:strand:- start:874 stop:1194 length:321 start_codon:yes stop_codon:yes gene_type:complete
MFNKQKYFPSKSLLAANKSLIDQLLLQLNKDLKVDSFKKPLEDFESLAQQIEDVLIAKQKEMAMLLYQIDINENQLKGLSDFKILSYMVLEREAQKVLFREQFKNI